MKIGQFANHYGVKPSVIRYYVDRALLTPERKNNQYIFNDSCSRDMETILKLKRMRFSLDEIELFFFLIKTSQLKDRASLQLLSELFTQKQTELNAEVDELFNIIQMVEDEAAQFFAPANYSHSSRTGIPITFIPNLCCPKCKKHLNLQSVDISGNSIFNGELRCEDGFTCQIKDGIIICEGYTDDTPFRAYSNVDSISSIATEYGVEYRQFIDQSYLWIYHQLNENPIKRGGLPRKVHIMTGPFALNFLLKHGALFSSEYLFIVIDPSLKKLQLLQNYFANYEASTVFIACNANSIPLNNNLIDYYIDDFSSTNHVFTYNRSPYGYIAPFLNHDGLILGLYNDFSKAPQSLENFKQDHPNFNPKQMSSAKLKANIKSNGWTITEEKTIGYTTGKNKEFKRQVDNEPLGVVTFKGVKSST